MAIAQGVITIALFLFILVVLVLVHELGHFVMARVLGVRVLEFGVGFPPRAKVLRSRGETIYTLNWLPIGGFVKMEGEDGDSDDPRSFGAARLWRRLVILVAGVAMNLLLAFAIFTGIALVATPTVALRFWEVQPDSPAAAAGLVPGDAILAVDGQRFEAFSQASPTDALKSRAGQTVTITILHENGSRSDVTAHLRSDTSRGALGINGINRPFEQITTGDLTGHPVGEALSKGVASTRDAFGMILDGLGQLGRSIVTNPTTAPPVQGPVGIATVVGETFWQSGPIVTLYLAGLLSANLALVNFLPIPPLDGGRMLVIILKAAGGLAGRGLRRVGIRATGPSRQARVTAEQLTYFVGFVFLLGFIAWVSYFDIARQLGGATP